MPIGRKPVVIELPVHRVECEECGAFRQVGIGFADERRAYTRAFERFAGTLQAHRHGILAYYDYPISTSPLEGTNNKIETLHKQAYGFRDKEFFKLKIYALHESRYALV